MLMIIPSLSLGSSGLANEDIQFCRLTPYLFRLKASFRLLVVTHLFFSFEITFLNLPDKKGIKRQALSETDDVGY